MKKAIFNVFFSNVILSLLQVCVKVVVKVLKLNFLAIQEQVKMKDQSLRKLQQEMDSLTFRNQQLAKRVELLQDELALSEARGKKNKVRAKGKKTCLADVCSSPISVLP